MPAVGPTKYLVRAGWDHAPHLTAGDREQMVASTPPHELQARLEGIPTAGVGRIYPMAWEKLAVAPFELPEAWPRAFALDPGWRTTAAAWFAWDLASETAYVYGEYKAVEETPDSHALAIRSRGDWIPGVSDPMVRQTSRHDGERLLDLYRRCGLVLRPAENAVEAGLRTVWQAVRRGRVRVFSTLVQFRHEYEQYHRDREGRVVKRNDHLMDCFRYGLVSGPSVARTRTRMARPGAGVRDWVADRRAGY